VRGVLAAALALGLCASQGRPAWAPRVSGAAALLAPWGMEARPLWSAAGPAVGYAHPPAASRRTLRTALSSLNSGCPGRLHRGAPAPLPQHVSSREGSSPQRRILAFGDSLTAGWHGGGRQFAPYGVALAEFLGPHVAADVCVCGLSGLKASELADQLHSGSISDMVNRTGPGLARLLTEHGPFDLALIMLGTNDIAEGGTSPEDILTRVQELHMACHNHGVRTVVLSVPPNGVAAAAAEPDEAYLASWQQLNRVLEEWATGVGAAQGVVQYVDVGRIVPFSKCSGHWEPDGLHFSEAGSWQLGQHLGRLLLPALAPEPAPAADPGSWLAAQLRQWMAPPSAQSPSPAPRAGRSVAMRASRPPAVGARPLA